jgi:hypothetical protein
MRCIWLPTGGSVTAEPYSKKRFTDPQTRQSSSNPPPIKWVAKFFPGSKAMGREVDQSLLPSAEVKNEWMYTSNPYTPSYRRQVYLSFHYFECAVIMQYLTVQLIFLFPMCA